MTPAARSDEKPALGTGPGPATLADLPLQPTSPFLSLRFRKPRGAAGSPGAGLQERAGACARARNVAGGARGGRSGLGSQVSGARASSCPRPPPSSRFGIRFPSPEPGQRQTRRVGIRNPARGWRRRAGWDPHPQPFALPPLQPGQPWAPGVTTTEASEPAGPWGRPHPQRSPKRTARPVLRTRSGLAWESGSARS